LYDLEDFEEELGSPGKGEGGGANIVLLILCVLTKLGAARIRYSKKTTRL